MEHQMGTIARSGGQSTITHTRVIKTTPEDLWDAITNKNPSQTPIAHHPDPGKGRGSGLFKPRGLAGPAAALFPQ